MCPWLRPRRSLALIAVVIAVPGPRDAVARWFGIGGVRFELRDQDELPTGLGSDFDLGEPVAASQAADAVTFQIRLPDGTGPPSAAFIGRPPGGITMVWPPSADLPEVDDSGVGLLLTEFPGSTTDTLVVKELGAGTRLEAVAVDGADGYWITGAPHVVTYLDRDGEPRFDQTRLAGNTLLWEIDGVTYRMESALGLEAMVEIAESLRPVD